MKSLIQKCEQPDFEFIIKCMCSPINFADDGELRKFCYEHRNRPSAETLDKLSHKILNELRYTGSNDIAYLFRKMFRDEAGVKVDEIIEDVAKKLKTKVRPGSTEAKLERIAKQTVERRLAKMSPDDLADFLKAQALGPSAIKEVISHAKAKGKYAILPFFINAFGAEATLKLVSSIIVPIIGDLVGREVVKQFIKQLAKEFPWWSEWLGPVAWGITGTWIAVDIAGPAFRKTIPIMLYLGIVALRDGPVDGASFWEADEGDESA